MRDGGRPVERRADRAGDRAVDGTVVDAGVVDGRRGALTSYGVNTPLQDVTTGELLTAWRRVDQLGFGWISVWDHLQALSGGPNLEAVSMHAALAMVTERARVGCLVYSASFRSPGVLAKAAATIDHLSGGRAVMGLGTGYFVREHEAFGVELRDQAARVRHLEHVLLAVRALLDGAVVRCCSETVVLRDALADPPPLQPHLPIWVGGGGERRTLPLAGRLADGWNVPMASVDDFRRKAAIVAAAAEVAGRDPAELERSVNVGLCWDDDRIPERYGARWQALRPAVLTGSTQQVVDHVAAYRAAGADTVILSLRAPFDLDEVERFATEVAPVLS